jgi:hypothetical protein
MTTRRWLVILILLLAGVWIGNGSPTPVSTEAAPAARPAEPRPGAPRTAPAVPGCWNVVPNPVIPYRDAKLRDVAVVSANDVWAVGAFYDYGVTSGPLIEHWDGTTWTVVPTPPAPGDGLYSVAARASNDVWAVGVFTTLHWNGTIWSVIAPVSDPGWVGAELSGVTIVAPNDVWAVGAYFTFFDGDTTASWTLIEHWDGTAWSIIPSPSPHYIGQNWLEDVTALAANNIWAVGTTGGIWSADLQTLIEHWDGAAWTVVPSPNTNPSLNILHGIAAVNATDIWAVGEDWGFLIEHWNGASWTVVPNLPPSAQNSRLNKVAAVSSNDVWVSAFDYSTNSLPFLHWDGLSWTAISAVGPADQNTLNGVAAVNANQVWAVGTNATSARYHLLAARYDYPCIPATPTPPVTATWTPTVTPTPTNTPTNTPIPTTTPHAGQFEDVPPNTPFYDYVECMGTRGIINGYPCGGPGEACVGPVNKPYFRPNNNVTRGQTAKIVSNAAGWTETPTGQHFADVPPGSPFYTYVERAYNRNIIGGYPCGGPFEPCVPPTNLPYYRPNNPVTRGQTAKIVAIAAGFTETPTAQTFEDVPPDSTFYPWVEPMAHRGIIGGYPCGGIFEPCLPPANRPYFRPNNNVTRGQTAKIVTNALLPNCQFPSPTPTSAPLTVTTTPTSTPTGGPPTMTSTPDPATATATLTATPGSFYRQ